MLVGQVNPEIGMECKEQTQWPIKTYRGVKCYAPPSKEVPAKVEPGKYEGGFQLWECTLDLLDVMQGMDFKGKAVFELGCGWGLPGIWAAMNGAARVVLQDFNRDVIEQATMPNAKLNECPEGVCEFSADAWAEIPGKFPEHEFDVILASETIYRKEQLPDFVGACKHLVKPDGIFVIAAKRTYFGLSGTSFDLIELVKDEYTHEVHEFKGSSAYTREVIVFKRKEK